MLSGRIIVKIRPSLARQVEAAFADDRLRISEQGTSDPSVTSFLSRASAKTMFPLYPGIIHRKKSRQGSAKEDASEVRNRFAVRARRAPSGVEPPDLSRTYVLELQNSSEAGIAMALRRLKAYSSVESAEPERSVSANAWPDDPFLWSSGAWGQWYGDLWGMAAINAAAAWGTNAGDGVLIAVVDSGLDYNHPELAVNVWVNSGEVAGNGIDDDGNGFVDDVRGWDFVGDNRSTPAADNNPSDEHGHGTHVAGTVAAVGNNGIGVIGVAWRSRVMAVRALDRSGNGWDSLCAQAIVYAAENGADIINNSWSGPGDSLVVQEAVDYAHSLGAVVVASAGNNSDDAMKYYPANLPQVITVAATGPFDSETLFSNWGAKIDVAAPGYEVLSLRASGTSLGPVVAENYVVLNGTSMAAPHVSGVAALILSRRPALTSEEIRQILRVSSDDIGLPGLDGSFGYGRVNASSSLQITSVLEARIDSPQNGARIHGATEIKGVARGTGFVQFTLEYGSGRLPQSWVTIASGTSPLTGTAGVFDPSGLPDGPYTVRLSARDASSRTFVDQIELFVDYVAITDPAPPDVPSGARTIKMGEALTLSGSADGGNLQSYRLEWARGINPSTGWTSTGMSLVAGGSLPVQNGDIGVWDTSVISEGDYYTIRLTVTNSGHESEARTLVYLEPALYAANWPKWLDSPVGFLSGAVPLRLSSGASRLTVTIPTWMDSAVAPKFRSFSADGSSEAQVLLNFGNYCQSASGDFDGDGNEEALIGDDRQLRVIRQDYSTYTFESPSGLQLQFSQLSMEDVDGDGRLEAISYGSDHGSKTAHIYAWRSSGSQMTANFPIKVPDQNYNLQMPERLRFLVGDLEGDGVRELVVASGVSSSQFTYKLFSPNGTPRSWNVPTLEGYPIAALLADLDHNGKLQLIVLQGNGDSTTNLHVFEPGGSERPGWPLSFSYAASLAVGDLDRDDLPEIVVAGFQQLHALRADGTSLPGWPVTAPSGFGPIVIADVNGDGFPEVLTSLTEDHSVNNPLFPDWWADRRRNRTQAGKFEYVQIEAAPTALPSQITYSEVTVRAYDKGGAPIRSWRLPGMNGHEPTGPVLITAGDFDTDGLTEVAAVYPLLVPIRPNWRLLSEGGVAVFSTGGNYDAAVNDWPMLYRNTRNSPVYGGVAPAPPPDFVLSATNAATVTAGQTAAFTITVAPFTTAYDHAVNFTCSGLPSLASCTFSPGSVVPGPASATVNLNISTTARMVAAINAPPENRNLHAVIWISVLTFGFAALLLPAKSRSNIRMVALAVIFPFLLTLSCGGGGGGGSSQPPPSHPGTPVGTYTITIEATGETGVKHAITVSMTVR